MIKIYHHSYGVVVTLPLPRDPDRRVVYFFDFERDGDALYHVEIAPTPMVYAGPNLPAFLKRHGLIRQEREARRAAEASAAERASAATNAATDRHRNPDEAPAWVAEYVDSEPSVPAIVAWYPGGNPDVVGYIVFSDGVTHQVVSGSRAVRGGPRGATRSWPVEPWATPFIKHL
jgi:hypothetical protein